MLATRAIETSTETAFDMKGSRILVVINPASGNADASGVDPLLDLLEHRLSERGIRIQIIPFGPQGLAERLHDRLDEDVRAIYVAGGDGTLLSVVEALGPCSIPLGILPRGTMNWMAKDLGIPLDMYAAIQTLLEARVQTLDLGQVNDQPFLCACMIGVGTLVGRERERERYTAPWSRWPKLLWRGLKLLRIYPHRRMRLVTEKDSERLHSHTVVVTNNLLDSAFGTLLQRTHLDAGVLGIYAVRKATFRELTRLFTRLMLGNWQADDAVLTTAATEASLSISGRGTISVMLDGEIRRLKTPLRFRIEPRRVAMLVPRPDPSARG